MVLEGCKTGLVVRAQVTFINENNGIVYGGTCTCITIGIYYDFSRMKNGTYMAFDLNRHCIIFGSSTSPIKGLSHHLDMSWYFICEVNYIPVIDLVLVIWESIYILSKIVQANLNMKVMLNFLYTATPLSYKEKHT